MTAASVSASASPARRRPLVRMLTRGKVLFPEEAPGSGSGLGRATCSSTMKEAKFPDALDLAPGATDAEGPAALRVCPYTYCSLNGHVHAPAVPLQSFLASRRRLIKTQQSMKLKGVSAFRKKSGDKISGGSGGGGAKIAPLIDEEAVGDFFVEVYAGPRVSSDMSCSDMSLDDADATVRRMEFVVFDRCGADENSEKGNDLAVCDGGEPEPHLRLQEKHGACRDSLSECSGADVSGDFIEELPWIRYHGYEYDSLDDEISEEQRMREDAAGGAEISEEQEENQEDEQGTSGRSAGDCEVDAAEEQKTIDDTSVLFRETDFIPDQGVPCRVEACEDPDGRDEDNILHTVCCGDASAGQATSEEKLSDDFCKSEIPDQEVTGWVDTILEERCKEETSTDPEADDDECSVESDGESDVTEEKVVKGEESTPDDDGSRNDLSEEVTSRAVPEDDRTQDYAAEQYTGTVDDEFGQDGSKPELSSEETATVQQTDQDGSMDGTGDSPKELEITTCILEEVVEGSGLARESSLSSVPTCVDDGPQVEPNITTCKSNGSSEESIANEESCVDNNAEKFTDGAERGPEITRCKVEAASEESGIDLDTVEDNNSACISDSAQNDLHVTNCKLEDTSRESVTTQETDECGSCANVSSDAQATVEYDDSANVIEESCVNNNAEKFTDGAERGPEITRCKLVATSEESGIDLDTVEDDNSACISDSAQNDVHVTNCKLEDTSRESVTTQETDECDSSANVSSDAQSTVEYDNSACVSSDAQNVLGISKHILDGASKESAAAQDDDQSDSSANVSSDAEDESGLTRSELAVIAISDDIKNESKICTCKSEDVSEESVIGQEADHDESYTYVGDGAQNEYEVATCHLEGAQDESDVIQELEDNTAGAANKLEITACELLGASLKPAMAEEADGDINTTDASDSPTKDTTMQKVDASEDTHFTEETNQSFTVQIPAEFTDAKETSIDDICGAFSGMNLKGDVYFDPAESATCQRNKLIISRRRRTPEEEEYLRGFNPRAPNFLPLELDPDAEKVDLKHQMMDERKNAEEWMIDYALRRAVTNLAPARKKKVELLVQAFETVLPHDEDEKKNISPTKPVQACN
ncbi:hypothetical protein BS78_09G127000 [Paspalum vaginatum]|nr:hypothetical protein BS78_09G127000 [Paspalum vaginatum]